MRSIKPGRGPSAMGAVGSRNWRIWDILDDFGEIWEHPSFCPVRGHLCRCRGCAGIFHLKMLRELTVCPSMILPTTNRIH